MLRGSCLCQGVAFEIEGTVIDLLYCHCAMCRKAHGSAFRARGKVKASEFRWVRGEALVRYYESSPGHHRSFCSVCGSNLITRFDQKPRVLGLALGVLDDDPLSRPLCHVHVGSKAPWHDITDALPQFEHEPTSPVPPPDASGKAHRLEKGAQVKPERWGGKAIGRSHTVARGDMVWSVSNAVTAGADFETQVRETLAFLESSLEKAGSSRRRLLSVQVLLADMARRAQFDAQWCAWIGEDPEHWPQRAVFQAALAPGLDIELVVTAYRE